MKEIAKILLDVKAVSLSPSKPYTWASGIKSPIYCDNRLTLSYPRERGIIEDGLAKLIIEKFPDVEYIMATATAGIGHGALVAERLNLPMGFVRGQKKDHGKTNQIEGVIVEGARTVVVEDLISTGKSSIETATALREAGFNVLGVVSIFTYEMEKAEKNFKNENLIYHSLTNYSELVELAVETNYIVDEDLEKLYRWKKDPEDESWAE